jgi:glycosyltransferase involved in cell wall biosynthesis
MVAHPFPPLVASGSFRTCRFARYLPEFDWQPIVLTIREEDMGQMIDDSLRRLIPDSTIIERTRLYKPHHALLRMLTRIGRLVKRDSSTTSSSVEATNAQAPSSRDDNWLSLNAFTGWFRSAIGLFFELLLATPDPEIGWLFPAFIRGRRIIRQHKVEAIYCTGPPHSAHLIACLLKLTTRTPLLLDFRDPWARVPWTEHAGVRRSVIRMLEKICVRSADCVVLNTPHACEDFRIHYPNKTANQFAAIPNGTDPDFIVNNLPPQREYQAGPPDLATIRLCHPGDIYGKRSLTPILGAMKSLKDQGFNVVLDQVGAIDDVDAVRKATLELNLCNDVCLWGRRSHQEVLSIMALADILVVIQPETSMQVPAKLYEMLAFRKPILALTGRGATAEILDNYQIGVAEYVSDPAEIALTVHAMWNQRAEYADPMRWERASQELDGRMLTGKLSSLLSMIASVKLKKGSHGGDC